MPKQSSPKLPTSDVQVELVYRKSALQVTAKGTVSQLAQDIESIKKFVTIAESILQPQERESLLVPAEPELALEFPVIKPTNSLTDNIQALFEITWGRTPRALEEISKALETNGVPDSDSSIGATLLRLVKQGQLRRIKKGDKWQYFRIPQ